MIIVFTIDENLNENLSSNCSYKLRSQNNAVVDHRKNLNIQELEKQQNRIHDPENIENFEKSIKRSIFGILYYIITLYNIILSI